MLQVAYGGTLVRYHTKLINVFHSTSNLHHVNIQIMCCIVKRIIIQTLTKTMTYKNHMKQNLWSLEQTYLYLR